ncbi:protein phosphatase 1 regulatory subunit 12B isoform X6 [Leptidea sinapis]|uniref:protein phosphatase 1 regulatory subunit 12B isoform X6 n=1 Tax=Leptidea sinapis TaxID=189913 RepID=UPI0021C320FE|nr:protein phosphatase 1 regulatory subunit 12B isoform X6 [Leptidea sinapis]
MDQRTSSAMFKRAEQLKRWEASDTNNQSTTPKRASRIQFSPGIIFLAACTSGDKDEVKRLLKLGADINTANIDGITALHEACIEDNFDMVQFLVENGADVNRADNEGWTPLHATANCGFVSIARYLLENGADVAAVNYDGELPVDIVGSDEMEQLLQKAIDETGIDCERSRNAEVTTLRNDALNWATNGYVEVRDPKTGGTPLHVAAAKGYVDVAKTLLEDCNAEPDAMDYEGWTPLHAAALWGQKETAAMLLHYGADPSLKNFSGQTCMDLVDQSVSAWLSDAIVRATRCANNNKRKISPPKHEVKRAEPKTTADTDNIVNEKSPAAPEIIKKAEVKPPKGRAPSPGNEAQNENSTGDEGPSWRRSASFKSKQQENNRENKTNNNNMDTDTILRRTHSFENDKTVTTAEKRENKANTWNTISNTSANTNTTTTNSQTTVRSGSESVESNSSNSTPSSATPTKLSPGNIFKNFFKSFVPPVRDEESETQRKAHAKRVRETRRSTQGVTLDEIKSAEQLVKKKTNNGTTETIPPASPKKSDENHTENSTARSTLSGGDAAFSLALACVTATATATIAANSERRPSWRLRLDPTNKFELEDVAAPRSTTETEATVTLPLRRPPSGANQNTPSVTSKDSPPVKENSRTAVTQDQNTEEEKDRESSCERKSSITSPASTQAALNVIQRRRRPKRRSTGVGHVDMDDIVNDRRESGEVDCDSESVQSGSERTEEVEEKDYKALYEASQIEVQRQRAMLATTEQQLREARATITRLTQVNQNSLSDIEKREKRAMERKLSEMEEELKQFQKLKAENERLRAENRALTRVVSKLTNSVAK